jgi:hypothetical protein
LPPDPCVTLNYAIRDEATPERTKEKHGVTDCESEEIFFKQLVVAQSLKRGWETRNAALGKTNGRRPWQYLPFVSIDSGDQRPAVYLGSFWALGLGAVEPCDNRFHDQCLDKFFKNPSFSSSSRIVKSMKRRGSALLAAGILSRPSRMVLTPSIDVRGMRSMFLACSA